MNTKRKKTGRKLLSFLLTLAMVVGLMPGMSMTAYAATDTYTALMNNATVVQFNGYNWYIIEDNSNSATEGTVTLLAADDSFGVSEFSDDYSSAYSSSKIKATLDAMTQEGGAFAGVAGAIVSTDLGDVSVTGAKLYLLSTSEAKKLNPTILSYNYPDVYSGAWWLRSAGLDDDESAACVIGEDGYVEDDGYGVYIEFGVRPALKLDLSKVKFVSVNLSGGAKATRSGDSSIKNMFFLNGTDIPSITEITYTAQDGYKFPEANESTLYKETNGITVTRTSDTVITVSGTPSGVANITVPDAVKDTWSGNPYTKLIPAESDDESALSSKVVKFNNID